MSTPVVDGSSLSRGKLVANVPMAAPRQDATAQIRFKLIDRLHDERAETVTHHTKRVWMRHETDHAANHVAICRKPFKTLEYCLHERQ